jgi:signal peptidase I
MAVVMALLLKYFVVEAYKIPTGSMQPTLIGDERAGIKDRILVDKLTYLVRDPRRWEVAVFRYPLDRSKSFVKRIVGIGPEDFRIDLGDLWHRRDGGEWQILRRPRSVQRAHWKRLDRQEPAKSSWVARELDPQGRWTCTGRSIEARGRGSAAFRGAQGAIVDEYLDGYPESLIELMPADHKESGRLAVGDLRVDGVVSVLPGTRSVTVVLVEGPRRYRFAIPGPAAGETERPAIDAGGHARGGASPPAPVNAPYRLAAGQAVRFAAQNLDDLLELELDGEVVCALEVEAASDQTSAVHLEVAGEGADFDDLMVYRDVYYTSKSSRPIRIPDGSYYMLGDNTQDSSDSREWQYAVLTLRSAEGTERTVRGNWRDRENPRMVGYGDPDGPLTHLVDEFGEKHWFAHDTVERRAPQPAPFVPREMIQGKALAVFWPLHPRRGIWRLKWVN